MKTLTSLLAAALLGAAGTASAALPINYLNKGTDLAFNPTVSTNIDLALAATANWQDAPPNPGRGVYDSNRWAVVFKFSSINIPANVTVTFSNHPSRAPVVWLVEGNATIAGTVSLNGQDYDTDGDRIRFSEPGPGGFRGGDSFIPNGGAKATSGFGPGGGRGLPEEGGHQYSSFATVGYISGNHRPVPTYGSPALIPLIGGSGAGPHVGSSTWGGGAGGGAILLAVSGNLAFTGLIRANGGNDNASRGTGGSIRIVCDTTTGDGRLQAITLNPPLSSHGRIRVECLNNVPMFSYQPPTDRVAPSVPAQLWPETNAPIARIIAVNALDAPADPRANMNVGTGADLRLTAGSRTNVVTIETAYLPTNAVVTLRVISTPSGGDVRTNATLSQVVSANVLRWQQTVVIDPGYHALQVVARAP